MSDIMWSDPEGAIFY